MPRPTKAGDLAGRLDSLYQDYNRADSASDPVHKARPFTDPADREIAGFCAGALAFGRVASVLNSIDNLLTAVGPHPAAFVRHFEPEAAPARMREMVHRWIRGEDLIALLWILRQMLERSGSLRSVLPRRPEPGRRRHRTGARQFFIACAGPRYHACIRPPAQASRRVLLLSPTVRGQRLQTAEPVSALDGSARRGRPRRLARRAAIEAHRAARHTCHQAGEMPSSDALPQSGMANGRRYYRVASRVESGRPGAL